MSQPLSAATRELLTKEETAERLRVSVNTLNHWIQTGEAPPSARIGKRRYWMAAQVDEWVARKFDDAR